MTALVKIRRLPGSKSSTWHVMCTACTSGELFPSLHPWMRAVVHADAVWWANWHAAEHARTRCGGCTRDHKVPTLKVLDGKTVRVGDRLFTRTAPDTWAEAS